MSRLWAIAWTRPVHTPQNFCAAKQGKKKFEEQLFQVDLVPVSGFGEAGAGLWGCGEGMEKEQPSQVQQPSQVEGGSVERVQALYHGFVRCPLALLAQPKTPSGR